MDFIFYYNRINLSKEIDSAKNNINDISKSETILLFENLALDHSVKPLSSLQLFFIPTTNGSPQLFLDPTPFPLPRLLGQFSFAAIMTKNIQLSKKGFFLASLHRAVKNQCHGQGLLMSCPGLLKTTLLGSSIKRKMKENNR